MKIKLDKTIKKMELRKRIFFDHFYKKYVVDYKIEGDSIKIIASNGCYKTVKNTNTNIKKINQSIVKNKVEIARRIDDYEEHSNERLTVLIINSMLLLGSGVIMPFGFFTGYYILFLFSILAFSVSVIATSITGFNYYILVKEISNLKKITGYKKDMEFVLPKIDNKYEKSHN